MATLSQLVSEFAHSLGQPNNEALRQNLKLLIIQTRNEIRLMLQTNQQLRILMT